MACARVFILSGLAVATAHADDKMMRRENHAEVHVHLNAAGELQKQRQPGETSWCDTDFPPGKASSNECIKGKKIIREEDCRHAAKILGHKVGENFEIKDDWVNPNPYAKDCFLFNGTVFFNPTESVRTQADIDATRGWKGTPICEHPIYQNGTVGENSDTGCTGDYEVVDTYAECEWAHDCQFGGMFCQDPNFGNDQYSTLDAPIGCYRNNIGCYGFNAGKVKPSAANITGTSPVCRLKGHKFVAHAAAHAAKGDNATAATAAPAATAATAATP